MHDDPKELRDFFRKLHQARKRFLRENARLRFRPLTERVLSAKTLKRIEQAFEAGSAFGAGCLAKLPLNADDLAFAGADGEAFPTDSKPVWDALAGAFFFGASVPIIGAKKESETFGLAVRWRARGRQSLARAVLGCGAADREAFRAFGERTEALHNAAGQSLAIASCAESFVQQGMNVHLPHHARIVDGLDLYAVWPGQDEGYAVKTRWNHGYATRLEESSLSVDTQRLMDWHGGLIRQVRHMNGRMAASWIPVIATIGVYDHANVVSASALPEIKQRVATRVRPPPRVEVA